MSKENVGDTFVLIGAFIVFVCGIGSFITWTFYPTMNRIALVGLFLYLLGSAMVWGKHKSD